MWWLPYVPFLTDQLECSSAEPAAQEEPSSYKCFAWADMPVEEVPVARAEARAHDAEHELFILERELFFGKNRNATSFETKSQRLAVQTEKCLSLKGKVVAAHVRRGKSRALCCAAPAEIFAETIASLQMLPEQ